MHWIRMTALLLVAGFAHAHGPMPQKVSETVAISAPPEAVWQRVKDFDNLKWHPAVDSVTADQGSSVGSVRSVKLKEGGSLMEKLDRQSDTDRSYSYQLLSAGPLPVSNYRSTLTVRPAGKGGSEVEWVATFMRADGSNKPAPDKNDAAAVQAVTAVYRAGLESLKQSFEAN